MRPGASEAPRGRPRTGRLARTGRAAGRGPGAGARAALWLGALAAGLALGAAAPGLARLAAARGVPGPAAARAALGLEGVAVTGVERVMADELARIAGVPRGTGAFTVDSERVAERVASHPWVASARVAVWPGGRVLLAVEEREPAAVAWLGEPPAPWHVDAGGTPFAPVTSRRALARGPAIRGGEDLAPGRAHAALARAVRILEACAARGLAVRALHVGAADDPTHPQLEIAGAAGPRRVLLGPADPAAALDRLAALLASEPPAARAAEELDVRFADQVILRGIGPVDAAAGGPPREDTAAGGPSSESRAARGGATPGGPGPAG